MRHVCARDVDAESDGDARSDSELAIGAVAGGWTQFAATTIGTGKDNPASLTELTEEQLNRAVTFYYSDTSGFELSLLQDLDDAGFVSCGRRESRVALVLLLARERSAP